MRLTITMPRGQARGALPVSALLVLATLLWGSNFVVGRLVGQELSPVALSFWRWLGALAALLALSGGELARRRRLILAHWRLIALLGLTGVAAYNLCFYQALRTTTGLNAALYVALLPLAIVLASRVIDGETVRPAQLPAMALSLLGAVVVIARGDASTLLNLRFNIGDLWMLVAVPTWAVYAVLQRRRPPELSPLALVAASVLAAVLLLTPLYGLELLFQGGSPPSARAILGVSYAALLPSAASYVLWNRGAAILGPTRAGVYTNLIPVFGGLLSVTLLGEALRPYHLVGAALVGLGIALARLGPTVLRRVRPRLPADETQTGTAVGRRAGRIAP